MATIQISQYTANPTAQLSVTDTLEVRGFYTNDFIAADAVTPVFRSDGISGPYYSITPTLSGGNLVVPVHVIQPTTLSNPTARYIEQLWVNGALSQTLMPNRGVGTGWQIPTVYGDPIAYDEIAYYNRAKRLLVPEGWYDIMIREIERVAGNFAYMAVGVNGIGSISDAPALASLPITLGSNNRQLMGGIFNVKQSPYNAGGAGATDDAAAIQAAIDAAKAVGSGTVYFPKGTYNVGTSLSLLEVKGLNFLGEGQDNTKIVSTGAFPVVQCNGIWRSRFQGILFQAGAANPGKAVFELDGNYDGSHTQGVQANSFYDCYFNAANLADYAFAICRQGLGNGQGSENIFINTGFISGGTLVKIYGGNALNNTFFGGNFQDFNTGIYAENGVACYKTAFQSTRGYAQITAGGADIDTSTGGNVTSLSDFCDSESLVHLKSGGATTVRGLSQRSGGVTAWGALGVYTLNQVIEKQSVTLGLKLYRVTTVGTSGAVEPTWPDSGTVADGSVVWTETDFDNITGSNAFIEWKGSSIVSAGTIRAIALSDQTTIGITTSYLVLETGEQIILADATAGNITVTLPTRNPVGGGTRVLSGQKVTVKKIDTSANTVTVIQTVSAETGGDNPDLVSTVIPGGSRGFVQLTNGDGTDVGAGQMRWWITASSFNLNASTLGGATFAAPGAIGGTTPAAGTFTTLIATPLLYTIVAFASGATTPSVAGGNVFTTANAAPTSITDFLGTNGQLILLVIGDANTTIVNGVTIITRSGSNITAGNGLTYSFIRTAGTWKQVN